MYLADRVAGIMALMVRARDLGTPLDWLLRAQHYRTLNEGDKLWGRVTAGESVGEIRFTLASRQGQRAREVVQRLGMQRILDFAAGIRFSGELQARGTCV